jgi:hypothetical protein
MQAAGMIACAKSGSRGYTDLQDAGTKILADIVRPNGLNGSAYWVVEVSCTHAVRAQVRYFLVGGARVAVGGRRVHRPPRALPTCLGR